jgi:hypothetical protein
VTVPTGSQSVQFTIPTNAVTSNTRVTITATLNGGNIVSSTILTPQRPPATITLDPTSVTGTSGNSFATVTVASPVTTDLTLPITNDHPEIATMPHYVTIPAGITNGGFNISTTSVSAQTIVTISVSGAGVTRSASLTVNPQAVPTPTPGPLVVSGTVTYCSNPSAPQLAGVTLNLTGSATASTLSDASGHYQFSSLQVGSSYVVTPSKNPLSAGAGGSNINTVDVIAIQRHFLGAGIPLTGCPLAAADVNGDSAINTLDIIAVQRFFIGLSSGIANVGKYKFNPTSRNYPTLNGNQINQDYGAMVFGDVAAGFVHQPERLSAPETNPIAIAVSLPPIPADALTRVSILAVKVSTIDPNNRLVGFQGDLTFDERVLHFDQEPIVKRGLTGGSWNVSGNVLSGPGPIRTLRISAFATNLVPLSGTGTLFGLRLTKFVKAAAKSELTWAAPPDGLIFVDLDLNTRQPTNR